MLLPLLSSLYEHTCWLDQLSAGCEQLQTGGGGRVGEMGKGGVGGKGFGVALKRMALTRLTKVRIQCNQHKGNNANKGGKC